MTENNDLNYLLGKSSWKTLAEIIILAVSLFPFSLALIFNIYTYIIIIDSGWPYYPFSIPHANYRDYFGGEFVRDAFNFFYGKSYGLVTVFVSLLPFIITLVVYLNIKKEIGMVEKLFEQ